MKDLGKNKISKSQKRQQNDDEEISMIGKAKVEKKINAHCLKISIIIFWHIKKNEISVKEKSDS